MFKYLYSIVMCQVNYKTFVAGWGIHQTGNIIFIITSLFSISFSDASGLEMTSFYFKLNIPECLSVCVSHMSLISIILVLH